MNERKGVIYDDGGNIKRCVFCNIIHGKESCRFVYEDENYFCFKTIRPATENHFLVCPKKHVQNINSLSGPSGARLVSEMKAVRKEFLS